MSTSPYEGVTLRRLDNGVAVMRIHYSADPNMTDLAVQDLRQRIMLTNSEAFWNREYEIQYEALEGERLFPNYAAHANDIEPFDCTDPQYWTWYMGCDPHGRTPHGFVWVAFGSSGDIVVAGELFQSPLRSVKEYSDTITWLESDSDDKPWHWWPGTKLAIYKRIMDTHGKAVNSDEGEDYFKSYRKHGLSFHAAKKGHDILETARDEINRLLLPERVKTEDGTRLLPRLYVSTTCTRTREQLENVRFPSGDVERPSDEKPETFERHLVDPLTYIFSDKPKFVTRRKWQDQIQSIYENIPY